MRVREKHTDELDTWQPLSLATGRLLTKQPLRSGAQDHQGRDEDEREKDDDEAVDREIARIKNRLAFMNWIYFALHGDTQRH